MAVMAHQASAALNRDTTPRRRFGEVLRHPVLVVVGRRILFAIPLLIFVSALSFILLRLMPGDTARLILGANATPQSVQALRQKLGLDLPLYEQYWNWLTQAVHGDLGTSIYSGQPVTDILSQRLPVTFSLMIGSLVVILLCGVAFGVFSAARGGAAGRGVDILAQLGFILPSFWVAALLISVFAVQLHWFPAVGYVAFTDSPALWAQSLVLPVVAISLASVASIARQTREAMLDVLASEHIRMARANGIPGRSIFFRYALKPTATRIVTLLGIQAVALIGGTVFVENVFAMPGLGSVAVQATVQQDLPLVLGVTVYFTVLVVIINLIVDLLHVLLDPRVRAA